MTQTSYKYHNESNALFNTIKKVADDVGRTAMLIEDKTLRDSLNGVLDSLAETDKNLAADIQAIEQFQMDPSQEEGTLLERFNDIRNKIDTENLGRCHGKLDQIRTNIAFTRSSQGGEEMETLSVTYSSKDPISKAPIKDPLKNPVCGHIYDRDSVTAYIDQCKKHRQLCQCPVRSCPNKQPLQIARMVPFPDFFNHIRND